MFPFVLHFNILGYPLEIGAYGTFFVLAAVVAMVGGTVWAAKKGYDSKKVMFILFTMAFFSIIGARLMNILIYFGEYRAHPEQLLILSATGFSLYGGIVGAVVSGYVTCLLLKVNPFKFGDTIVPFLGISIATMRIGCFLQGCCFGKETNLPWGVKFPALSPAHLHQLANGNYFGVEPVHPTQLYELTAAIVLSVLSFRLLKKNKRNGTVIIFFMTGFSLFRMINFYLRETPDGSQPIYEYYPLLYLALVLAGTTTLVLLKIRNRRQTDTTKETVYA